MNNAIFSLKESVRKKIEVRISIGERKIRVNVSDTGCGIKEGDADKIFDREYSTKKEGGFGLYHAKVTLNKYGGKIKVVDSTPGEGTTMQLEIRRS
jgi:sensor histidine kinase regulating citrate/malate metabolism